MKLKITWNSKSNHLKDGYAPINLVVSVAKQTTFLKVAQKILVTDVIKKDILLLFVLTKPPKEEVARPATRVITLIDNALKTTAEDVLN